MTIDGKDLYTEWGCKLLEGSFDDLLKYPKRKAVKYNNWAEADGSIPICRLWSSNLRPSS